MYILNINKAVKKMSLNKIRDFFFENFYNQIGFLRKIVITH